GRKRRLPRPPLPAVGGDGARTGRPRRSSPRGRRGGGRGRAVDAVVGLTHPPGRSTPAYAQGPEFHGAWGNVPLRVVLSGFASSKRDCAGQGDGRGFHRGKGRSMQPSRIFTVLLAVATTTFAAPIARASEPVA